MTDITNLFEPHDLSGLVLKNRVVMAPLTRGRADPETHEATALMAEYYEQRASVGLIIAEGTEVSEQAFGWLNSPGIWTDAHAESWKQVTTRVHEANGIIFLQLWHLGRAAHSDFKGLQPVAPSAIATEGETHVKNFEKKSYEVPRALETDEIATVVAEFKNAAEMAKKAGFDGVEVHGANGYLLDEFTQSKTNKRTDAYGGSLENRLRFPLEVLDAVTSVFPSNRVGYRISPNGAFNSMGSEDYEETFLTLAAELEKRDLAYLHVMDGKAFGFHGFGEGLSLADVRKVYTGTLMGNCGHTKESASVEIKAGNADLIAFGRPIISNPDIVQKFKDNAELAEINYATLYSPGPEGYTDY